MPDADHQALSGAVPFGRSSNLSLLRFAAQSLWPHCTAPRSGDAAIVAQVQRLAADYCRSDDTTLEQYAQRLREQVRQGARLLAPEILVPAFALVSEAVRRTIGLRLYDVQLLAALALARGAIAEMQTGEGKTLAAAAPAMLHALAGRGVHVMTVNSYLAQRDFQLLAPVFQRLGLSVGLLEARASQEAKVAAYACDITYGPGYEFGFDYLRDQAALLWRGGGRPGSPCEQLPAWQDARVADRGVQRGHAFAIVDEIDSVLIDEATTPLILSEGPAELAADEGVYRAALEVAGQLTAGVDYAIDHATMQVRLSAEGTSRVVARLPESASLLEALARPWTEYVEQALRANLLQNDVDYVVDKRRVVLVDQSTGRLFPDRSWRDGLHQAVEVKEGLAVTAENRPVVRIARQQYFRLYQGLCGMTGTATGSETEFWRLYRLQIVVIPLRTPCRRVTPPVRYFANEGTKWDAIVATVAEVYKTGQPILVGTRTIEKSELMARRLAANEIPYRLLNGRQDASEAEIIATAGQAGTVTIATNMAGRGTDIRLGPGVDQLGGLHVIGTEMHESARIDRQLIGRSARQGDPGSCQCFVSADDPLISHHAAWLGARMQRWADGRGEVGGDLAGEITRLQRRVERRNYARRRGLLAHDRWLEDVLATLAK
jgi:preprotein translocase subunit SecA